MITAAKALDNLKTIIFLELIVPLLEPIIRKLNDFLIGLKQLSNAIFMYLYLQYYRYKIRNDFKFMVKEAIKYKQDLR